jgi:hypothetical protein
MSLIPDIIAIHNKNPPPLFMGLFKNAQVQGAQ